MEYSFPECMLPLIVETMNEICPNCWTRKTRSGLVIGSFSRIEEQDMERVDIVDPQDQNGLLLTRTGLQGSGKLMHFFLRAFVQTRSIFDQWREILRIVIQYTYVLYAGIAKGINKAQIENFKHNIRIPFCKLGESERKIVMQYGQKCLTTFFGVQPHNT